MNLHIRLPLESERWDKVRAVQRYSICREIISPHLSSTFKELSLSFRVQCYHDLKTSVVMVETGSTTQERQPVLPTYNLSFWGREPLMAYLQLQGSHMLGHLGKKTHAHALYKQLFVVKGHWIQLIQYMPAFHLLVNLVGISPQFIMHVALLHKVLFKKLFYESFLLSICASLSYY